MTKVTLTAPRSQEHVRRLRIACGLAGTYLIAEAIASVMTGNLALLADAGHMLTDVVGVGLALFAIILAQRPAPPSRTYAYHRAEILAVLGNAALLLATSGYVLVEAYRRFLEPPIVESGPMLAVAVVGLAVNITGIVVLRDGSSESLNVKGAYLEVVSDALSSIGRDHRRGRDVDHPLVLCRSNRVRRHRLVYSASDLAPDARGDEHPA